nr:MAG TPA: hypothetical protein [Caudoviricetes sp.]
MHVWAVSTNIIKNKPIQQKTQKYILYFSTCHANIVV